MNDETMPDEIKAFIPEDNNYVKWSNNIGMWDSRLHVQGTSYTKTSLINEKSENCHKNCVGKQAALMLIKQSNEKKRNELLERVERVKITGSGLTDRGKGYNKALDDVLEIIKGVCSE